jgi:DNA modification methylase
LLRGFVLFRAFAPKGIGMSAERRVPAAERIALSRLRAAPWNANRVPARVLARIRNSLLEFGVVENLVARPHPGEPGAFEVVSGNHRLALLRELGFAWAPVVVVELDDAHARLLAQTLNRARGEDDPAAYARLLEEVLASVDVGRALAFLPETETSIERALRSVRLPDPEEDAAPELPPEAVTEPGELVELGPHRLLCADARDPEQLQRLLAGELAEVLWTDPPYGVDYVGKTKQALRIANDQADGLTRFLAETFAAIDTVLAAGGRFYIACPDGARGLDFRLALREVGWRFHQTLVWVKNAFVLGHCDYHYQHEDVLYGWKPGAGRPGRGRRAGSRWYGDDREATVFFCDRPARSEQHPTMKPVELIRRQLLNSSRPGEIVLDAFAGSGSTLIACEQTGRRARLVELDPRYCDVIRQRYQEFRLGGS